MIMNASTENNVWTDRFGLLLQSTDLAKMLTKRPEKINDFRSLSIPTACDRLEVRLGCIRVTSEQDLDIVRELLGLCHGHALSYYGSAEEFAKAVHSVDVRLSPDPPTRMLTSEPGLGKSVLTMMLEEVLGAPLEVPASSQLPPQRFVGVVRVCIEGITRTADLLNDLAAQAGIPAEYRSGNKAAIASLRRQLYRVGVMLIVVDELQFMASTASANATIARTLHLLRQLGIPLVFVGNFSLGHKLLKRPPEDQQRFLSQPMILLADAATDASFIALLQESVRVMDGALSIAPEADAPMIHWYTGGNRRFLRKLLVLAYRRTRKAAGNKAVMSIKMADLHAAYKSEGFSVFRSQIEVYRLPLSEVRKAGKDLVCPFDLPPSVMARRTLHAKQMKELEIRNAALVDSMPPKERAGLDTALAKLAPRAPGLAKPTKSPSRKVARPTLEQLLASKSRGSKGS
jgi:hypothetical protein